MQTFPPRHLLRLSLFFVPLAGLAAILADEPRPPQQAIGQPRAIDAKPRKALRSAPQSASAVAKATARVHGRLLESAPPAPAAPGAAPEATYAAYHVEFADADSCSAFHADGVG